MKKKERREEKVEKKYFKHCCDRKGRQEKIFCRRKKEQE